jgi:hypothetical protein
VNSEPERTLSPFDSQCSFAKRRSLVTSLQHEFFHWGTARADEPMVSLLGLQYSSSAHLPVPPLLASSDKLVHPVKLFRELAPQLLYPSYREGLKAIVESKV